MPSTDRFRLPHFPLAQINRTRSPTKAGWLTVVSGPCFFVTFCFFMVFVCIVFFLHFSRSTPKGPPPRRRFFTFFIFRGYICSLFCSFSCLLFFASPRPPQDLPESTPRSPKTPRDPPKIISTPPKTTQDFPKSISKFPKMPREPPKAKG